MSPIKLSLISFVFIIGLATCSIEYEYDYKFGPRKSDYPEYFPASGRLNNTIMFNKEYSWLTRLPIASFSTKAEHATIASKDYDRRNGLQIGSFSTEVEHGVIASEEDIKRVGLKPGRYLFFSLDFRDVPVRKIWVSHTYKGAPLEIAGTFIFHTNLLADGKPDPSRPNWNISNYAVDEILKEKDTFGYVRFYKLPDSVSSIPSDSSLHEQINLEVETEAGLKVQKFSFITHWHKATSFWYQLSHIT